MIIKFIYLQGQDYEIRKYQIPYHKILPGLPDGKFSVRYAFNEADNDPYVTINVEGSLTHKIPGIPNIPGTPGILGIGR